jgi:hypothetical protein
MSPIVKTTKGKVSRFVPSIDPQYDRVELAKDDREFWPELFAHEDAHRRLGHRDDKDDGEYPVEIFNDEVAAWNLALSRVPNGDFRESIVRDTLKTHLDMIAFQFGTGSRKYTKAKKQFDGLFAKYFQTKIGKKATQKAKKKQKQQPSGIQGVY